MAPSRGFGGGRGDTATDKLAQAVELLATAPFMQAAPAQGQQGGDAAYRLQGLQDTLTRANDSLRSMDDALKRIADSVARMEKAMTGAFSAAEKGASGLTTQLRQASAEFEEVARKQAKVYQGLGNTNLKLPGGGGDGPGGNPAAGYLGALGLPAVTGALAAFTLAVKAADTAARSLAGGFHMGQFQRAHAEDLANEGLFHHLPAGLGTAFKEASRSRLNQIRAIFTGNTVGAVAGGVAAPGESSYRERADQLARAQDELRFAGMSASAFAGAYPRQAGLRGQLALAGAQARFGLDSAGAGFGITTASVAASEAAQRGAQGVAGYGREAQQQDMARRAAAGAAAGKSEVESQRQLNVLGAQQAQNAREEEALRGQLAGKLKEIAATQQQVTAAEKSGVGDLEEQYKLRLRLLAQQEQAKALEGQLQQTAQQGLQMQQQRTELIHQGQQQRLALMQQERDTLTQIVAQERQRRQALEEQLGLMLPLQKASALAVARKLEAGQQLTGAELRFAQSNQAIFGDRLRQLGAANYRNDPVAQELARFAGLGPGGGVRERAAEEARVKLDQSIRVQIEMNAQAVSDQLTKQLTPEIYKAMQQVSQAFQQEMQRVFNQIKAARAGAGLGR